MSSRNPSVRGANRQLNRPNRDTSWRHHEINTLSMAGRDGPTSFSMLWRLPFSEIIVELPSSAPANWCVDFLCHPEGVYIRHSKSFPWLAGDIVVSIGNNNVSTKGLNREQFAQLFEIEWMDGNATGVVVSCVLREKPVTIPHLWWKPFPTEDAIINSASKWSLPLPKPESPVQLLVRSSSSSSSEGEELHPRLHKIVLEEWFDTFSQSHDDSLSCDGVFRWLNSHWGGRTYHHAIDDNSAVSQYWLQRFNRFKTTLSRTDFLAAIRHECRVRQTFIHSCLRSWGYDYDSALQFGVRAAPVMPLIADLTHDMLTARFHNHGYNDADDAAAEDKVLGNWDLIKIIASFLYDFPMAACVTYAVGIPHKHQHQHHCKNPLQLLQTIQPNLQLRTLLDIRANSTRPNFSPKHVKRACEECNITYIHFENDIHHDKFDKVGNVACVRTLDGPVVLLGEEMSSSSEDEKIPPPRLANFTARLVEHGIAIVIHIRLTEKENELSYAIQPQRIKIKHCNDQWVPFDLN